MTSLIRKLFSAPYRFLYWPICRTYARLFVKDKPADRMYDWLCRPQFRRICKYRPNFRSPRRLAEKIWSRMLYDRDPRLTLISDKIAVRDYVAERIGREYLIPHLWHGESPDDIPFERLPDRFVIKPNHACEFVILVNDKAAIDKDKVRKRLKKWLKVNYGKDTYLGTGWAYNNIKPAVLIESFIGEDNKPPADYKFWCFGGRVELVSLHFDRFGEYKFNTYDRDFRPHALRFELNQWTGEFARPANFEAMVRIAETLAKDFDFIRVDLYTVGSSIYFGELTPYPGGVSARFLPVSQDEILGDKWPSPAADSGRS